MKKIIYVDIDGTISYNPELPGFADRHADYKKAEPHPDRIAQINKLYDDGHEIHYWTARGATRGVDWTDLTREQLDEWGCKYHQLHMGKPNFDVYVCDKSFNSEHWFTQN